MKSLEGLVSYPWPMPTKRMVNGAPVADSDSDGEDLKANAPILNEVEGFKKIALIVDTNVLLKQTQLRELLKVRDQVAFEDLFEVITLDSVIGEIRDEASRNYVATGLPYNL